MSTKARRPRAFVLTVGDELLLGDRADTNAPWIAAFLSAAGFAVEGVATVGDDTGRIGEALSWALKRVRAGVVIMTGGLGPTTDDVSREAVAEWLGVPLLEDPAIRAGLEAHFRARGFDRLPVTNLRLTQVPAGAEVLPNGSGTAPGLLVPLPARRKGDAGVLVMLPGVPTEMKALMRDEVAPRLRAHFGDPVDPVPSRILRTAGIPESALAEQLEPLVRGTPGILVQYRPSWDGVELRVSAAAGAPALDQFLADADGVLRPWTYGGEGASLASAVLSRLATLGWTLGVAESCTGGLLGARLTAVPGSSATFLGGVISYANEVKTSMLGVPAVTLQAEGAVSEPVARSMAEGAARAAEASVGVAITGVAGPGGGSPHRPVGTVWFGLVSPATGTVAERVQFPGGRDEIRHRAAQHALRLIYQAAEKGLNDEGSGSIGSGS
jgi:nicotinamide-nucleotide amidase